MPPVMLEDYHKKGGGSAVLRYARKFIFSSATRRELALGNPVALYVIFFWLHYWLSLWLDFLMERAIIVFYLHWITLQSPVA